jgi:hypothetical protein
MSICQRCQQIFTCAMADKINEECWCIALPKIPMPLNEDGLIDSNASCFCPSCLSIWITQVTRKNKAK